MPVVGPEFPPGGQLINTTDATVVIGRITFDTSPTQMVPQKGKLFTDFEIRNKYWRDGHVYMGGVTSPGGFNGISVAFVQLATPTLLWVCDWTASRVGIQPNVPDPFAIAGTLWVLLDMHAEPASVALAPDGRSPLYRISGTYYFGCTSPSATFFDQISFGRAPWMKDFTDRTMPLSMLMDNLANNTSQLNRVVNPNLGPSRIG